MRYRSISFPVKLVYQMTVVSMVGEIEKCDGFFYLDFASEEVLHDIVFAVGMELCAGNVLDAIHT